MTASYEAPSLKTMAAAASQSLRPLDLAIIGGGISGVTLAIALYKRGVSCTVYEAAPKLTETRKAVPISRNALCAMEQIDRCVLGAFNLVSTRNQSVSKRNVWGDFVDGMSPQPATNLDPLFSIVGAENVGHNVVPCARFLDELVRLLPRDTVRFDKELKHVLDDRTGSGKSKQYVGYGHDPVQHGKTLRLVWKMFSSPQYSEQKSPFHHFSSPFKYGMDNADRRVTVLMKFADGSLAEADAIIGCDGVRSRTRAIMVGEEHPAAVASYTHKYAYRGHVPMSQASMALGAERAMNATCWVRGRNGPHLQWIQGLNKICSWGRTDTV